MTPIGYMYKYVSQKPDWIKSRGVEDIYSVSGCISEDFYEDWINSWKHNGYWFFNSPSEMDEILLNKAISSEGLRLFFYFVYEKQWVEGVGWEAFEPEESFETNVILPKDSKLEGYDVVTFWVRTSAECSPLSCNSLCEEIPTNKHCLLESFESTKSLLENNSFEHCEPGPYRIFEVHSVSSV